jgi:hypothetical protein
LIERHGTDADADRQAKSGTGLSALFSKAGIAAQLPILGALLGGKIGGTAGMIGGGATALAASALLGIQRRSPRWVSSARG